MILITGAYGFIGSCLVRHLNDRGHLRNLIVVDDFYKDAKIPNLDDKFLRDWIHRDIFLPNFRHLASQIDFVFHLGARTDTVSKDKAIFEKLNLEYSKAIWQVCTEYKIPLLYASSAATYGDGAQGFDDRMKKIDQLKPLNEYARSKQAFDEWALAQKEQPPHWYGLKFFNVYGPNEYHKKRMASVVFHAFRQIRESGQLKLFRSHKKGIADGGQQRDFIYVKDVARLCHWFMEQRPASGLYNLGTGRARTFADLGKAVFDAMDTPVNIEYIDTPADIRKNYQYFTEAKLDKLRDAGYSGGFTPLEDGVKDYVQEFLMKGKYW